jgi:hypothetical protein
MSRKKIYMKKISILFILSFSIFGCNDSKDSIREILTKESFFYIRNDLKNEKSTWINSIKFKNDNSFEINCYLSEFCGNHNIKGSFDEIDSFDFDEMDNNFKENFSYLEDIDCFKVSLNFDSDKFLDCEWDISAQQHIKSDKNPLINFRDYPFALICKDNETEIWSLFLITNYYILEGNYNDRKLELKNWELATKSDRIKVLKDLLKDYPTDEKIKSDLNIVNDWAE